MSKVAKSLAGLLLLLLALAAWGFIEPRVILDERWEEAVIPGLPAQWEDRKIAVLADFQVGMWLSNDQMIEKAVARTVTAQPAAVLLAGDFLYQPIDEESRQEARDELEAEDRREVQGQIAHTVALLRPLLAAGIPTYAVLGNHDYLKEESESAGSSGVADDLMQALRRAGVTVLRNEAVVMKQDGPPLYLGGIDSLYAGRAKPEKVLAAMPSDAPRILLMHHPDLFGKLPPDSAPLAIAGHTHGGQIRVPGFPRWSWMAFRQKGEVTADGWIHEYGAAGNRLYVNRGIGFSLMPIRIACPPELTWLTLRKPAATAQSQ
jgi:predicted MPP superfamily phosphohydrolase